MQGAHDLEGAPGLVDAQVGDDVREPHLLRVGRRDSAHRERVGSCGSGKREVGPPAIDVFTITFLRGSSAARVAEKPLPNWNV